MSIVPENLASRMEEAGWYPGRRVAVDSTVPRHHPAYQVIEELGGLRLMVMFDDYQVCEAEFRPLPDKDDLVRDWEQALGTELVGIGEHHNEHGEFWMAGTGFVFGNSIIHPAFWLVGTSFAAALDNIIAVRRGRPMLLEREESAMHYGRAYTRDDPEVLLPSSPQLRPDAAGGK